MKHEPSSDLLQFLRSKNILPNGYFSLEEPDGTYTFYSVSRSGVLYTLDLEPAALSADDVWEKLDRIQKISREVFEQAQESLWDARRLARGLPTSRELKPVAEQFYKDYTQHYAEGRWKTAARYDEETIRHILNIVCSNLQGGGQKSAGRLGQNVPGPCPGKGVSNPTRYLKNKKRKSIDNGVIIGYTR